MALFKPYKITSDKLSDLPVREGQIVVTTDTKKLYVDVSATERIEVTSDAEVDLTDYVTTTMLSSAIGEEASERQKQDSLLDDKIDTKLDTTQADGRYALKDNPKLTGNVDISNEDWQGGKITAGHSNGETDDYYKYVIGFDSLHRPYIAKKEGENTVSTIYLASDSIVFSKPLSFTDSSGVSTNPEAANQTRQNIGAAAIDHTHDVATPDADGFMSAEDKAKLDGLEQVDTSDFVTKEDADASYAAIEHNHDDRYYTESEVDSKLADKANATHTHAIGDVSNLQETIEGLEEDIAGKANAEHTHDDRYFTETEVTEKLATKADTGHKHAASDVTSGTFALDRIPTITDAKIAGMSASKLTGTIPTANLPSYVDDVVEGATTEDFPETGEAGKIYVATSTNKTYRWGGSSYVEISASLALGTTSSTAFRGDYGNVAYTHATAKGAAFASGLYKITTNAQGHVTAATAVTKADITALGIPGSDTNTNTTYTLTKSGSTITLTGSDGKKTSVTDSNTTYSLSSFGITATAAELNKLDGVTTTATQLNYLNTLTGNVQTQLNGKAASSHTHKYAGSSSAGGAATSAAKINGIRLTNQNLNNYYSGVNFYYAGGGNTCTNKPSGVDNFGMFVFQTASGWWTQVLYGSDNNLWTRRYASSSWTSWAKFYSTRNKPTASEIGAAASSHSHSNYLTTSGTAAAATKLATARTFSLTGDVTGSASFNGTANCSIATTLAANSVTANEIASGAVGLSELSSAVGTVAVQSATPTDSHVKLWIKV